MVEGAALEMLYKGNFIEGSNPSLSVLLGVQEVQYCPQMVINARK